jgi:hypothetical protein
MRPSTANPEKNNKITKRAANLTFKPEATIESINFILDKYKDLLK